MKIKDLLEVCEQAVSEGREDADVFFDSCAVCFDTHLVGVKSTFFETEVPGEPCLILNFSMMDELFHRNDK